MPESADGRLVDLAGNTLCVRRFWPNLIGFPVLIAPGYHDGPSDVANVKWRLHLDSNLSHLPFQRALLPSGDEREALIYEPDEPYERFGGYRRHRQVHCWELMPANLAPDERFEFRVPP